MGLGAPGIQVHLELWQRGLYENIRSVIDMGSQDLTISLSDFEKYIRPACLSSYKKENFANLAHWPGQPRCSTRMFYELLGVKKYSCVDIGGAHGAIVFDLNLPFQDRSLYGQYDLVTDYGNNEHVFNVAEAYRTMHRLCRTGGYIACIQAVYKGNGYYSFEPSFFEDIAAANSYKIIFSSYIVGSNRDRYNIPLSNELLDVLDWTKVAGLGICYVMQKQKDADFCYPYQGHLMSKIQGNCGYKLQFYSNPPSRAYVPVNTEQAIRTKDLLPIFITRVVRKVKNLAGFK